MVKRLLRCAVYSALGVAISLFGVQQAYAQTLQSNTYRFEESAIGTGGVIDASSPNFRADNATGDLVVGNSSSANYQIDSGSLTPFEPALSFGITSGAINFGNFSASTPTVTTATFTVSNYTTYGYIVQIVGDSPANGSYTIPSMTTTGPSSVGTGQFGINLVANTSPSSVGANPDNGQFGFGIAAPNYATANQYRFVSGETIAQATRNSGITNYTISYLINVAPLTPGGQFTADQTLIVTGTY